MSLTSFLKCSPDVRERFKAEFLMPPLAPTKELLAQPLTENASLVGTAFDYFFRFYLERLNPNAKTRKWVAKQAVFDDTCSEDEYFCPPICREVLKKAISDHKRYLQTARLTTDSCGRFFAWLNSTFCSDEEVRIHTTTHLAQPMRKTFRICGD